MAYQLSPGINSSEVDLTTTVPGVATTDCAFCGPFMWGPVQEITLIDSENVLYDTFGPPASAADAATGNAKQAESWMVAASFLSYASKLHVVRATDETVAKNATANGTALLVRNKEQYEANVEAAGASGTTFIAKYPGTLGNSLKVGFCADGGNFASWQYASSFDAAPGTSAYVESQGGAGDEIHVVVLDKNGKWTGASNTVLERWPNMSLASDAKNADGTSNYYKNVLRDSSKYIYWGSHPTAGASYESINANVVGWGSASNSTSFGNAQGVCVLSKGVDGNDNDSGLSSYKNAGYILFADKESVDISLIAMGEATAVEIQSAIDNVALTRKDCVVFYSPLRSDVVNVSSQATQTTNVTTFRNTTVNRSTSYAFMDSGYKKMYDRYNDRYLSVALNGDIAGLCARTDTTNDPWWSPAGFNRGQLKNVVSLYFNPRKTYRDDLYKASVNPVVTFAGSGPILYGDKTTLSKPSAFDRIGVRRLFIVLEKAIERASNNSLFEFNDEFTRAQFRNLVEPFLEDVKGRRGIYDFKVVCDDSNNTPEVIDRKEFVGDIFIKPARSINFIQLNFIAARTGADFAEIGA